MPLPPAPAGTRALVNHLVSGNLRAAELAADGTIEDAGSRPDGDLLGDDPAAALDPQLMEACRQIVEPQVEAFRSAGAFGPEVAAPADTSTQTAFSRCWAGQAEPALLRGAPLNATATDHSSRQVGG